MKIFIWITYTLYAFVPDVSGVDTDEESVFVMEGDSVTLNTPKRGVTQKDRIKWYYNDIRIAQMTGDQSKICTEVECDKIFRDRLELNRQTGSLTITNINSTDSGLFKQQIITNGMSSDKIFNVSVHDVPAAELKTKTVMEGESVTLDPGVMKKPDDLMTWIFNDILVAEITVDQSKICTDDQCKERFRDRLKLDHQTGSLTITNIRNADSGEYKLEISSSNISIRRRRSISITSVKSFFVSVIDSGLSSGVVAGIVVGVLLVFGAVTAGVIYFRHHNSHSGVPTDEIHDS